MRGPTPAKGSKLAVRLQDPLFRAYKRLRACDPVKHRSTKVGCNTLAAFAKSHKDRHIWDTFVLASRAVGTVDRGPDCLTRTVRVIPTVFITTFCCSRIGSSGCADCSTYLSARTGARRTCSTMRRGRPIPEVIIRSAHPDEWVERGYSRLSSAADRRRVLS